MVKMKREGIFAENDPNCTAQEFADCFTVLEAISQREDLALAATQEELNLVCRKLQQGVECIEDHSFRCFTAPQKRIFKSVVSESKRVIDDICVQGKLQEDYLRYAPCLKNVSTDEKKCANQYKKLANNHGANPDDPNADNVNYGLKLHCKRNPLELTKRNVVVTQCFPISTFKDAKLSDPGIDGPPKNDAVEPRPIERTMSGHVRSSVTTTSIDFQIPRVINVFIKKDRTHVTIAGYATPHCDVWLIQLRIHNDMFVFICLVHRVMSGDLTRQFKTGFICSQDLRKED
ncbi:uncharacterized protein TNCT_266581 [Trichonephila clavata]|uniref:Uncharacterized protein n=1 Tax=Trichonephila clavata TaxID=2740835 RepID=A0A8X6FQA6_TRICU|nr:uncharacterized protein TNCT_266581 [Trichonephila clavata]